MQELRKKPTLFIPCWTATRAAAVERMLEKEGEGCMWKLKETEVTLQVSPGSCQQQWWTGMSENRADDKREKWAKQEQRSETEQLSMHSLHAGCCCATLKMLPQHRFWFHIAHLPEKRPDKAKDAINWAEGANVTLQNLAWTIRNGLVAIGLIHNEWSKYPLKKG